jgi:lysine 2,3-aminomutase
MPGRESEQIREETREESPARDSAEVVLDEQHLEIQAVGDVAGFESEWEDRDFHLSLLRDVLQVRTDIERVGFSDYLNILWLSNPELHRILLASESVEDARARVNNYLYQQLLWLGDAHNPLHRLEKATARQCILVFMNLIATASEARAGFSVIETLFRLARREIADPERTISAGFLLELIHLFRGMIGQSSVYEEAALSTEYLPRFLQKHGRAAALERKRLLDEEARRVMAHVRRYPTGLEREAIRRRRARREQLLKLLGASEEDWFDYRWQLRKVVRDARLLAEILDLDEEGYQTVARAAEAGIPIGATPYYLSLTDEDTSLGLDTVIRRQVIPPADYVEAMLAHQADRGQAFDFMGEADCSPIPLITRRYPMVAIVKPFNSCAQICVYCQRNWELDTLDGPLSRPSKERIQAALDWISDQGAIGDVLLTGGDPILLSDGAIEEILATVAANDWVYRIRIGTRTPVVLPMRWTENLIEVLARYHEPGKREVAVVTHFEHPYEVTPEARDAVRKIRQAGMSVYNQAVFTRFVSRRFELVALRLALRKIGVDPYYTFNTKGKPETRQYLVPIARILQERKEEARLLPGMDRTDEPVFNVPRLGKNHLRAGQDHRVVMIHPDGAREYEFHPWEKMILPVPPYNYKDVPIFEYLRDLYRRGENLRDYRTIFYYF